MYAQGMFASKNPATTSKLQTMTIATSFSAALGVLLLALVHGTAFGQNTRQASLMVTQQSLSNAVELSWTSPLNAGSSTVEIRKFDGSTIRMDQVVPDASGRSTYIFDNIGEPRELQIIQQWRIGVVDVVGTAYVSIDKGLSAMAATPKDAIVIVDKEMADGIRIELITFVDDLVREGWLVSTHELLGEVSVDDVKQTIRGEIKRRYPSDLPSRIHVILLGALPYAYSGGYNVNGGTPNPDYHTEHGGAWASDAYYGDISHNGLNADRFWTDRSVNIVDPAVAAREENRNTQNDGKFDQHIIPTDLEVCVGRVDFRQLPAFGVSDNSRDRELELMKSYFDRNHDYRSRAFVPPNRAVIDDNFGAFSRVSGGNTRVTEAFATSGYRSFAPIVSADSIYEGDWIADTSNNLPTLDTFPALFSYGCGGGGYAHCSGVATSAQFATNPLYAPFALLFGSYFGDVDSRNNLLRSALAADGWTLTVAWSGRPHWFIHRLASGATMGECQRLSANNDYDFIGATIVDTVTKVYQAFTLGARNIHMILIGDPTLQLQGPTIPGTLAVMPSSENRAELSWSASTEHGKAPSQQVAYVIETGPDGGALTARDTVAPTETDLVSAVVDIPAGHSNIRVRPYFTAEGRLSPLFGRGVLGSWTVSSVEEFDPSHVYTSVLIVDLLGRRIGEFSGTRQEIHNQLAHKGLPQGLYVAGSDKGSGWTISVTP